MKSHKVTGKIDEKGSFKYANLSTTKDFFRQNKDKRVVVTFEIIEENVTQKFLGWFYAVILPQVQEAFKESGDFMTFDEVEVKIKELCPQMQELKFNGQKNIVYKEFEDLTNTELKEVIDTIIRLVAENLNFIINI